MQINYRNLFHHHLLIFIRILSSKYIIHTYLYTCSYICYNFNYKFNYCMINFCLLMKISYYLLFNLKLTWILSPEVSIVYINYQMVHRFWVSKHTIQLRLIVDWTRSTHLQYVPVDLATAANEIFFPECKCANSYDMNEKNSVKCITMRSN